MTPPPSSAFVHRSAMLERANSSLAHEVPRILAITDKCRVDASEDLTQHEVVAALRDHVRRARDAARKASKDGQHQAASVALKLEGEALTRLAARLPATASGGEEATTTAARPGGLSDEMARSIMVQTLGLSEDAADRMLSGKPAPAVARYKPAEVPADDAEQRFEERVAEPEPPKAPPPRPVGTVRMGGDHTVCQCDDGDLDADCPAHGGGMNGRRDALF